MTSVGVGSRPLVWQEPSVLHVPWMQQPLPGQWHQLDLKRNTVLGPAKTGRKETGSSSDWDSSGLGSTGIHRSKLGYRRGNKPDTRDRCTCQWLGRAEHFPHCETTESDSNATIFLWNIYWRHSLFYGALISAPGLYCSIYNYNCLTYEAQKSSHSPILHLANTIISLTSPPVFHWRICSEPSPNNVAMVCIVCTMCHAVPCVRHTLLCWLCLHLK